MGKYLDRKKAIEARFADAVDSLAKSYEKQRDALSVFNDDAKKPRMAALIEDYNNRIANEQNRAISAEEGLFIELSRDLEEALTAAPTDRQLAFLQTMSLKSSLGLGDIQAAEVVMSGNAVAMSALSDISGKHGIFDAEWNAGAGIPRLKELQDGLEAYRKKCVAQIRRYGSIDPYSGLVRIGNIEASLFLTICTSEVFDEAEAALERYGAK